MFTFYSRQQDNTPRNERVTFVGEFTDGMLKIAAARCSKRDQFARKKGFTIAQGRLTKNKLIHTQEMPVCTATDFVNIAKTLAGDIVRTKIVLLANKPAIEPQN